MACKFDSTLKKFDSTLTRWDCTLISSVSYIEKYYCPVVYFTRLIMSRSTAFTKQLFTTKTRMR